MKLEEENKENRNPFSLEFRTKPAEHIYLIFRDGLFKPAAVEDLYLIFISSK